MVLLLMITVILVMISFIADKEKTLNGLKIALNRMKNIFIPFTMVLMLISVVLFFFPAEVITQYLSNGNQWIAVGIASLLGSVTIMPGFIAFPLSGVLKQNGVIYMVLSAFTSTLMMVGVITFPLEKAYLGMKVALLRNLLSLIIALLVAVATGILFGEIL